MIMNVKSCLIGLMLSGALYTSAYAENVRLPDEQVMPVIRSLSENIDSMTTVLKNIETAKPGAFWSSKESFQEKLNSSLDEALNLVLPSTYPELKKQLRNYDKQLEVLYAEQSEWREIAETGIKPEGGLWSKAKGVVKGVRDSVLGAENEITSNKAEAKAYLKVLEQQISDKNTERNQIFLKLSRELEEKYGLKWSKDQARAALIQVNGNTIVEAQIVPRILFSIEMRLKELQALKPDRTKAREYYGVAVISRLLMLRLYQKHLYDYDEIWLPNIATLYEKNADEIAKLNNTSTEKKHNKLIVENNIQTRRKLEKAIQSYQSVLQKRRDKTLEMMQVAEEDANVAVQTLRVLEDLNDFSAEANKSFEDYFALSSLDTPELLPLDNDELIDQFIDLSGQLAGS